jgi:hypothetical protein
MPTALELEQRRLPHPREVLLSNKRLNWRRKKRELCLEAAACERLFTEQVSSVAKRDQLAAALDFVRRGMS